MMLTIALDPVEGSSSFTLTLTREDAIPYTASNTAEYATHLPAISDFLLSLAAIAKSIEMREPGEYPKKVEFMLKSDLEARKK